MKHALIVLFALFGLPLFAQKKAPVKKPVAPQQKAAGTMQARQWETTPSGLKYIIINPGTGRKAELGDLLSIHFTIKNNKDSVFTSSYDKRSPNHGAPIQIEFAKPQVIGDLMEAFQHMGKGDSAIVRIPSDSIFKGQVASQRPAFIKPGTDMIYTIKIMDIVNQGDRKKQEEAFIQKYINDNHLPAQKTASGLYYVIVKDGAGEAAKIGDKVKVNYIGMLLNGSLFDTNIEDVAKAYQKNHPEFQMHPSYEAFEFDLGKGRVIKGWDEGIALLKVGTKAKLIIPSELGYGAQGAGASIPPYSPLVFDVELLGISK